MGDLPDGHAYRNMFTERSGDSDTDTVTVGSGGTLIKAANSDRFSILIQNVDTTPVYIGESGVTTAKGLLLQKNDIFSSDIFTGAIYGRVAVGTADVRVREVD